MMWITRPVYRVSPIVVGMPLDARRRGRYGTTTITSLLVVCDRQPFPRRA